MIPAYSAVHMHHRHLFNSEWQRCLHLIAPLSSLTLKAGLETKQSKGHEGLARSRYSTGEDRIRLTPASKQLRVGVRSSRSVLALLHPLLVSLTCSQDPGQLLGKSTITKQCTLPCLQRLQRVCNIDHPVYGKEAVWPGYRPSSYSIRTKPNSQRGSTL